ncbi:MAG TPA: 2OG-Fe(II) oxygenase [Kofleriaceae bacterium]
MNARVVPEFFDGAAELRAAFEALVDPARSDDLRRFVWDLWHVPDQYTYVRTIARRALPGNLVHRLTSRLRAFGEAELGCIRITEPWLSYYVTGCRQELHRDTYQGAWSFVYSLTDPARRRFRGGDTLVFPPDGGEPDAHGTCERIAPHFNQLVVFDARLRHAVEPVDGTMDPCEARVVIHGWFLPPTLLVDGALRIADVEPVLADARSAFDAAMHGTAGTTGALTLRLAVDGSGRVTRVQVVVDTLWPRPAADVAAQVAEQLAALRFPAAHGATIVTAPFSAASP